MGDRGLLAEGSALCRGASCSHMHVMVSNEAHRVEEPWMLHSDHPGESRQHAAMLSCEHL